MVVASVGINPWDFASTWLPFYSPANSMRRVVSGNVYNSVSPLLHRSDVVLNALTLPQFLFGHCRGVIGEGELGVDSFLWLCYTTFW